MERIELCNIPVDAISMQQTLDIIDNAVATKRPIHHVVVNAAKMVNAQKDQYLRDSIIHCDIINADGQAVVWASRLLKKPLPERVAGIDLMEALVLLAARKKYKIFFLGAKEEVVKTVVDKYSSTHGNKIIAGYRNGYFKAEDEKLVAEEIAASNADILFVAMSSPKKEIFLETYKNLINAPFIMGVGGSFDVVAGLVKRAPIWMQKAGLEWFFRFAQEPGRMWKRYLYTNVSFIYMVSKEKIRSGFRRKGTAVGI